MFLKCVRVAAVVSATVLLLSMFSGMVLAADAAAPAAPAVVAAPPPVLVHGYIQNRLYIPRGSSAEYRVERLSISAIAALPKDSTAYTEVYYQPYTTAGNANVYLESAYYDTGLGAGRIRVGKGRRMTFGMVPAYPNRKTTNYGEVAEAFTQDRIQGVQYLVQKGVMDSGISLYNGYRLGVRNIGDVPGDTLRTAAINAPNTPSTPGAGRMFVVPHLCFREADSSLRPSNKLAVSARLGGKWNSGFKAGASVSIGKLDDADLALLKPAGTLGGVAGLVSAGATKKTMDVWGLDASYKHRSGFVLQGEYYKATVSELDYNAWDVLAGFEAKNGWKFFARYGLQNMDTPLTANPLSWDTKQLSLSVVEPLRKGLWLQYEYEKNMEDTNTGADIPNDIFFVELFSGF